MWEEYYKKLNEKNRRISMNDDLENITKQLKDENHFDVEPITETTTVDFETWKEHIVRYANDSNNVGNHDMLAATSLFYSLNILGFMLESTETYKGIPLQAKFKDFSSVDEIIDTLKGKNIFICRVYLMMNFSDSKPYHNTPYWKLRYATLED